VIVASTGAQGDDGARCIGIRARCTTPAAAHLLLVRERMGRMLKFTPVVAAASIAACSFLYDPSHLPSPRSDAIANAGIVDAMPADSASPTDVALDSVGAAVDSAMPPADTASPLVDAPPLVDSSPLPADSSPSSPDAPPPCGALGEACCANAACDAWLECSGGACRACGGPLQSCCDPGASCQAGLCLTGLCT
jgi:hypothetical protein